jgi:hypothetical protein
VSRFRRYRADNLRTRIGQRDVMLYAVSIEKESTFSHRGSTYRFYVYRREDNGKYFGCVAFEDNRDNFIGITDEVAGDMKMITGDDPIDILITIMVAQIDEGVFP